MPHSKRVCLIILILAGLLLPGPSAMAVRATCVNTGFISERKTTFISLYRDGVASPMPLLVSELAQNVDALDNIFHRLQNTGRLLPGYPVLAVEISDDAYLALHILCLPNGTKNCRCCRAKDPKPVIAGKDALRLSSC